MGKLNVSKNGVQWWLVEQNAQMALQFAIIPFLQGTKTMLSP